MSRKCFICVVFIFSLARSVPVFLFHCNSRELSITHPIVCALYWLILRTIGAIKSFAISIIAMQSSSVSRVYMLLKMILSFLHDLFVDKYRRHHHQYMLHACFTLIVARNR